MKKTTPRDRESVIGNSLHLIRPDCFILLSLVAKLSNEATEVKALTGQLIGSFLQIFVTILAGGIIACVYSWRLFLVVIACLPILIGGSYLQFRAFSGTSSATKVRYEKASKISSEAISNIRTVAPLGKEPVFLEMYNVSSDVGTEACFAF
jgi:ATP-binding cassette subfamily B (MDR/TAP) protein 1